MRTKCNVSTDNTDGGLQDNPIDGLFTPVQSRVQSHELIGASTNDVLIVREPWPRLLNVPDINVTTITVPDAQEQEDALREDRPILAQHFADDANHNSDSNILKQSDTNFLALIGVTVWISALLVLVICKAIS